MSSEAQSVTGEERAGDAGSSASAARVRESLGVGSFRDAVATFNAVILNLLAFAAAAILEIAGCFAFWIWLRRGGSPAMALLGVVSLVGFAAMLTRVNAPFAGRAYAAYGGVYIAASLAWLWLVEGQRPTSSDVLGAGLAIAGAVVIIGAAVKRFS